MKLLKVPEPKEGTVAYKLCEWFCNNINWCHGYYYGTEIEKPENKIYNALYNYWLFPFENNGCLCCNTTRGVVYGVILGFILGRLL